MLQPAAFRGNLGIESVSKKCAERLLAILNDHEAYSIVVCSVRKKLERHLRLPQNSEYQNLTTTSPQNYRYLIYAPQIH